ncbi:Rv3235 family protein [Sinomonas halotolerans]|uniref:Rv3235 family protein n=1 Tax=Sinomonas halotolerans TaxID=1644133 RepID=A0ABU9WY34_9MICC
MSAFTVIGGTAAQAPTAAAGRPAQSSAAAARTDGAARTADVLRFHRPRPKEQPKPDGPSPRTVGTAALALTEKGTEPERRLRAVPAANEAEDVRRFAATITLVAMEVLAGTRPVQQLTPWLHRDLLAPVSLRAELGRIDAAAAGSAAGRRLALVHRAATVKAAHASLVGDRVYEATVVVGDAARCRAVALRIEARPRTGWHVTALEIG